jgi:hypothetical protein
MQVNSPLTTYDYEFFFRMGRIGMMGHSNAAGRISDTAAQDTSDPTGYRARSKARKVLFRPALDAAVAFAVFCILCLTLATAPTSAGPNVPSINGYQFTVASPIAKAVGEQDVRPVIEIATTSSPANADAVYRRTSEQAAWALLMIGLSLVVALNMALFRHMKAAYTPPRRRNSQD